jgi:hypothetical protein
MHALPFDRPGRFYRGGLHAHSTLSDGRLPIEETVGAYLESGYDFMSLTEHFQERFGFPIADTRPYRTDAFTTLIGAELHAPALENGAEWHILAFGLPLDFAPPAPQETGPDLSARAAAAGAFVAMAHPNWYGQTVGDALTMTAAHAVEVFNADAGFDCDRADSWHFMDMLLQRGERLFAIGGDDTHFTDYRSEFNVWVQVKAESLEPEQILAALKAGHFYTSMGPEFHAIRIAGDRCSVACSAVSAIWLSGPGPRFATRRGRDLTKAEFSLDRFRGGWCRVTVMDAHGMRAWSNPIWLE